jgi:type VI secretion system secreted protein Hcp
VQLQDIHFVKAVDKSSPALFKRVTSGQRIKKAVLFVRKAGGDQQDYMKVTMSDVLVSSYKTEPQAPGSNTGNTETISFNVTKIEFAYSPQNADGSLAPPVTATYDLKAAKK